MTTVYVLNSAFECISQTSLGRALVLIEERKAEVVRWGDGIVRSVSGVFRIPLIIRIFRYVRAFGRALRYSNRIVWERDDHTCFIPNTPILMWDGDLKPISCVEKGDRVIDAYGMKQTVMDVRSFEIKGDILEIRRRCIGDYVGMTPDHKLLVASRDGSFDPSGVPANIFMSQSGKGRGYLFEPCLTNIVDESNSVLDLLNVCCKSIPVIKVEGQGSLLRRAHGHSVPRFIVKDFDLGKLFGYFLAEGCVRGSKNTVNFCFHIKETSFVDDVRNIIKNKFNLDCKVLTNIWRHTATVRCHSIFLYHMFLGLRDKTGEKRFAQKNHPLGFLRGVLAGMLLGDGSFNTKFNKCVLMLGDEALVKDMYIVALMIGLYPSLSKTFFRHGKKPSKSVIFAGAEWDKITSLVFPLLNLKAFATLRRTDRMFVDRIVMTSVTDVVQEHYSGRVHDLEVSGSHTYVAGFMAVHNCQYCGKKITSKAHMTTDHVVPASRGGRTLYENMVTCCMACNHRKKNRTPEEAGMKLLRKPFRPLLSRHMALVIEEAKQLVMEGKWDGYGQ